MNFKANLSNIMHTNIAFLPLLIYKKAFFYCFIIHVRIVYQFKYMMSQQ